MESTSRKSRPGPPAEAERDIRIVLEMRQVIVRDAAIRQAVERGSNLTYRLLAFSRRQVLQPQEVDTDTLVQGIAELIRRTVGPAIR